MPECRQQREANVCMCGKRRAMKAVAELAFKEKASVMCRLDKLYMKFAISKEEI